MAWKRTGEEGEVIGLDAIHASYEIAFMQRTEKIMEIPR